MQQPNEPAPQTLGDKLSPGWEPAPSPTAASFAGLLAALTAPAQPPEASVDKHVPTRWRPAPSWNDDDLADDVTSISYESALKAHARFHPPQISDRSLTQPADTQPFSYEEASSDLSAAAPQPPKQFPSNLSAIPNLNPASTRPHEPSLFQAAPFDRNLKDASITIRMSKAECEQLHRRAAEAGLSVSAYLRSCTFEAESLRAMVKDTMTQLRSVTAHAKPAPATPSRFRRMTRWLRNLITPWNSSQHTARA